MLKSEIVLFLIVCVAFALIYIGVQACRGLNEFYNDVLTPHCHMCGCETEIEFVCEKCDEFCCYDCALKNTYMNPIEYHCCGDCGRIYYD